MENKPVESTSIADNIKTLEACVKKMQRLSENYKPLPRRMLGYNIMNDPLDMSDPYWDPFKKEDSIDFQMQKFKKAISSLVEQKDSLSQVQFYTAQNRIIDITELAIKTHRLEDATQFVHLISSGELEGKTSPMKHRSDKIKSLLLNIVSAYKKQHKELEGGIFSKKSTSDSNKQYKIEKSVEEIMDDLDAGKYGEEFKGQGKESLYHEIEKIFFAFGKRYYVHDPDMY